MVAGRRRLPCQPSSSLWPGAVRLPKLQKWDFSLAAWIPVNTSTSSETPGDEACATYLKAVADPTRLAIIRALQVGPLSVSDIAELLEHEMGVVSHHLRVLYHADIVQTRRDGKYIYYSL